MSYYNSFVRINNPPSKEYREFYQELVNYSFENASTYYSDIGVEVEFGTLDFKPCDARITTLVDAKTGQRVNDWAKMALVRYVRKLHSVCFWIAGNPLEPYYQNRIANSYKW